MYTGPCKEVRDMPLFVSDTWNSMQPMGRRDELAASALAHAAADAPRHSKRAGLTPAKSKTEGVEVIRLSQPTSTRFTAGKEGDPNL